MAAPDPHDDSSSDEEDVPNTNIVVANPANTRLAQSGIAQQWPSPWPMASSMPWYQSTGSLVVNNYNDAHLQDVSASNTEIIQLRARIKQLNAVHAAEKTDLQNQLASQKEWYRDIYNRWEAGNKNAQSSTDRITELAGQVSVLTEQLREAQRSHDDSRRRHEEKTRDNEREIARLRQQLRDKDRSKGHGFHLGYH